MIARQVSAQETTLDFVVTAADRCESGLRARFVDPRGEPAWTHVALWEALRELRRELAEEQGVPPYVIFHDRTLQEMCVTLPTSIAGFGRITGVGERKLDKYGPSFLAVINRHLSAA